NHLSSKAVISGGYNRGPWLAIPKLGANEGETSFPDPAYLFAERKPSGRVDLGRRGNTIEASTQGVKDFTLLLSPDAFDFNSPVKVLTNGRVAFEGRVQKSVATLLKWAGRDNDRTMLFAAELKILMGKSQ